MYIYDVTLKTDIGEIEVTVESEEELRDFKIQDLAEEEAKAAIDNSKLDYYIQR